MFIILTIIIKSLLFYNKMSLNNCINTIIVIGSTHLFYTLFVKISNSINIINNRINEINIEINNIKDRITDLEEFRLKAYERNLSMMETRKWEEDLDLDYDDEDEEEDDEED